MAVQGQGRLYLGAVSLNNSGILLAERGHYRQALMVLRDSMSAMREASSMRSGVIGADVDRKAPPSPTNGSARARSAQSAVGLEGMLRRASRFVMDPVASAAARRVSVQSHVLDVDGSRFRTEEGEGRSAAATTAPPLALIRIDAARARDCAVDGGSGDEIDLEAIAILHNFAVLPLLLPFEEQRLRRIAAYIADLALCFVQGFLSGDVASAAAPRDPNAATTVLQMSVVVARCSSQLHMELGEFEEASRALSHIRAYEEAVVEASRHVDTQHAKAA
jgi:hypothetical protein